MKRASLALLALVTVGACSGEQRPQQIVQLTAPPETPDVVTVDAAAPVAAREAPPALSAPHEVHFPAIARSTLRNGLEVDVVEYHTLPIVQLRLVARAAGSAGDPADRPGLASFTGDMLKEGTRRHSSAEIAETIEFVGGTLEVSTTPDATVIAASVLKDHIETALTLMTELATEPRFPESEIDKLRRRELDRLAQSRQDPQWLSRRAFYPLVYGSHPYGRTDTTPEALRHITRGELVAFHRTHFVAGSMLLAVAGDVRPTELAPLLERSLGHIARGTAPVVTRPAIAPLTTRQVVIIDRPGSAQSLIRIGNLGLRRNADEWVTSAVANMVLGAEPSSRLFMDLRERRSLTYGAYSRMSTAVDPGLFAASGAARTAVTAQALDAFFEQLHRIVSEPASQEEIAHAEAYLTDSFPLSIETPAEIVDRLVELRVYGLPDTYWDEYRTRIASVTPEQALTAARALVHPEQCVVVIVGVAEQIQEAARRLGPVRVVDVDNHVVRELPAAATN